MTSSSGSLPNATPLQARSAPSATLERTPLYNVAQFSFEWSAVVAREHLTGSRRNTDPLAWLGRHSPSGCETGTGGGAYGPIDAASCRGGAYLLREHKAQPAMPGGGLHPDRPDHTQDRQGGGQVRPRGRPAGCKGED